MYKIHLNLDELTLSLLFFMGFDNKFKINLFFAWSYNTKHKSLHHNSTFFGGCGIMQPFHMFTFLFTNRCVCINEEAIHS